MIAAALGFIAFGIAFGLITIAIYAAERHDGPRGGRHRARGGA